VINTVIPFAASFLFIFSTMTSSGYMLQAVTDEKENRTMEIILTSLTPAQLIGGKSIGLLAVAFTQIAIYILTVLIGLRIATPYVEALQQARISWPYMGIMISFFIPTFALFSGMMITVGSAVSDFQQGQQFVGLLNMIFLVPLFLISVLFENPGSPLMVLLSLFPPTAFLTLSLRWGFGSIPLWQWLQAGF
jgi:ABC-2 type transport system permease protein